MFERERGLNEVWKYKRDACKRSKTHALETLGKILIKILYVCGKADSKMKKGTMPQAIISTLFSTEQ